MGMLVILAFAVCHIYNRKCDRRQATFSSTNTREAIHTDAATLETSKCLELLERLRNKKILVEKAKAVEANIPSTSGLDNVEVVKSPRKPKIRKKCIESNATRTPENQQSSHFKAKAVEANMPSTSKVSGALQHTEKMDEDVFSGGSSSEDDDDWEEVGMLSENDDKEPEIPKEGVQITLDLPDQHNKRHGKKQLDWDILFRRKVMRYRRDIQEATHKTHLLCLIAGGIDVYSKLQQPLLRATILSLQPIRQLNQPTRKRDQKFVENVMNWYRDTVKFEPKVGEEKAVVASGGSINWIHVLKAARDCVVDSGLIYVAMFLVCLQNCGMDVRLVVSLQPLPLRLSVKQTNKKKSGDLKQAMSEGESHKSVDVSKSSNLKKIEPEVNGVKKPGTKTAKTNGRNSLGSSNQNIGKIKGCDKTERKVPGDVPTDHSSRPNRSKRSASTIQSYKDLSEDEDEEVPVGKKRLSKKNGDNNFEPHASKSHKSKGSISTNSAAAKMVDDYCPDENEEDDDDFVIVSEKIRNPGILKGLKRNRKALSSESDDDNDTVCRRSIGTDHWIEVYLASAKSWICVDCVRGTINRPQEMEEHASKPMSYVLAFSSDGLKDVTRRYASGWMSQCRKLRVSSEWWEETLMPFLCPSSERDTLENQQLDDHLLEKPLPKSISEFKNHPLYVLTRHLLKFEGIYPADSIPVGYLRGESVYARECVHTLHSRETWVKDARMVKIGETPYKVVKARPKWNRAAGKLITDVPLELFGKWQTNEYVSPPAENGVVPRNEYGNVELFKTCMLPKGTVHLKLSALNRVAKKLGIDCARAMTGWDFHGVGSHPVFDGWIVCEEFEDVLVDAWRLEQIAADKREREKREKRIYGNWRRIIRGLLIKKRLASRYINQEMPTT